jgi:hypothetical protein
MAISFKFRQGPVLRRNFPEHATAGSFVVGDMVELNGGKVRLCSNDDNPLGVAMKAASGTEDTSIEVMMFLAGQEWSVPSEGATALANVGNDYGINLTAGAQTVDLNTTGTFTILEVDPRETVGTSGGRLIGMFRQAVLQVPEVGQ